jgi:hypothetical protein
MQMPMPQNGARSVPRTEIRLGSPAIIIAAATLVLSSTNIDLPLMVIENWEMALLFNRFFFLLAAPRRRIQNSMISTPLKSRPGSAG